MISLAVKIQINDSQGSQDKQLRIREDNNRKENKG